MKYSKYLFIAQLKTNYNIYELLIKFSSSTNSGDNFVRSHSCR